MTESGTNGGEVRFPGWGFPAAAGAGLSLFLLGFACFAPRELMVLMLSDDAYYYLNIARNLAATGQPSFDGITLTTGFHPLFGFLLAGLARLGTYSLDGWVRAMLLLNVLAHLGTAGILFGLGRDLRSPRTGFVVSLLYLVSPHSYLWILTGMETSVNALTVSAFLWVYLRLLRTDRDQPLTARSLLLTGLCATLTVWARIDNVLLIALAGIPFVLRRGISFSTFRNGLLVFGLPLAGFALWLFYCQGVVGEWVQGSARMKNFIREIDTGGLSAGERFLYSWRIFRKVMVKTFFKVPALKFVLLCWLWGNLRRRLSDLPGEAWAFLLLTPPAFALLFASTVDHAFTRYYAAPVMLWLLAAAFITDHLLTLPVRGRFHRVMPPLLMALLALEGAGYLTARMLRGRNPSQPPMLEMAEYINQHLEPGARIAAWNAGIYGYYSERAVVNLDGLVNHEIHALWKSDGSWIEYLDARGVQYLVDNQDVLERFFAKNDTSRFQQVHEIRSAENHVVQLYLLDSP